MNPYVDAVTVDEIMPRSSAVVVVGGGIIGVSAALALAVRGIAVVLCEKGYIACEQSSRNWGWCRQAGRDEREMPLIVESLRQWRDMNRVTQAETGFRQNGVLYVGDTDADEAGYQHWAAMAAGYGVAAHVLSSREVAALMPGATHRFRFGMHVASDGCAEPQLAAPAIARAAQRHGAVILGHCAVRGLELRAGSVAAVVTERGVIACDAVVLAGGAWTSMFCGSVGLRLPQLKVLSSVLRTSPTEGPDTCTYSSAVGYRKRRDGGYTLARGSGYIAPIVPDSLRFLREFLPMLRREGAAAHPRLNTQSWQETCTPRRWRLDAKSPFERQRVLDPAPNEAMNREAFESMVTLYPQFRHTPIVQQWAGYIDVTPDIVPYIGAAPEVPGLTVATGFSGHGFGIGPAAGLLAAQIATGASTVADPTPFRLSRFSDGSPIVLGPEL